MADAQSISRGSCAVVLLTALVSAQSAVFFSGRTLLPLAPSVTTQAGFPFGYSGTISDGPSAIDPAGSLNVSYLFDIYALAAFKEGTLPFWNPYQGLGQPHLANGLSAVLYPLNLLFFLVPHTWWDIVYLVNWLLAAFFVTEYLRLIGASRGGILVGGVAVLGSGFFQYYLAMREVVAVAAWFPLLLYALERTARDPEWRHRHWVLALAVACCLTAGQPESSFVALSLSGVYALVTVAALGESRWRFAVGCVSGTIVGLMVSAPFWLNFSDYAFKAYSNHPAGTDVGRIALHWSASAAYLFPLVFGRMHSIPFGLQVPGWHWDFSPGWMPVAVGLLALVGVVAAIRERQRPIALTAGMGLLIAGKIWGLPGATILSHLPLFERVIYPRYAAFVVAICAAVLAGVGFDRLQTMDLRRAARITAMWIGILAALYGCTRVWMLPIFASSEVRLYSILGLAWAAIVPIGLLWVKSRNSGHNLAIAAGAAMLLQLAAYMPGYASDEYQWLSVSALALWCLVLVWMSWPQLSVAPLTTTCAMLCGIATLGIVAPRLATFGLPQRYDVLTVPPYVKELRQRQQLGERVYAVDGNPQPNFGAGLRVHSLNTLEILAPQETAEFITTYLDRSAHPLWLSGATGGRQQGGRPAVSELADNHRYFDLSGVRYVTSTRSIEVPTVYDTARIISAAPVVRPLTEPVESWFNVPVSDVYTIEVLLSTYGHGNPGTARLTLLDSNRTVLGESTIPGELVRDNSYTPFHFSGVRPGQGARVGLRLSFESVAIGSMLGGWAYPTDLEASFVFRVPDDSGQLRKSLTDERTGVTIWERPGALPRAFLATTARVVPDSRAALRMLSEIQDLRREVLIDSGSDLRDDRNAADPGDLTELRVTPNRVRIRYQARTAGILTLTDSYSPGWTATVNGRPSEVHRVDGVFRGVRIPAPGAYVVEYSYRPPKWFLSCGLAALGFLALGVLTIGWGRA
jgi:Bacterial membrane protein YfhO